MHRIKFVLFLTLSLITYFCASANPSSATKYSNIRSKVANYLKNSQNFAARSVRVGDVVLWLDNIKAVEKLLGNQSELWGKPSRLHDRGHVASKVCYEVISEGVKQYVIFEQGWETAKETLSRVSFVSNTNSYFEIINRAKSGYNYSRLESKNCIKSGNHLFNPKTQSGLYIGIHKNKLLNILQSFRKVDHNYPNDLQRWYYVYDKQIIDNNAVSPITAEILITVSGNTNSLNIVTDLAVDVYVEYY